MIRKLRAALALLEPLAPALAAAHHAQHAVDFNPVTLMLPRLHPAFDGLRLVQISDLHLDGRAAPEDLLPVMARVTSFSPDVVALTGDFVSNHYPFAPDTLAALLNALPAEAVRVAVLGNHDHRHPQGPAGVLAVLQAAGVVELANRVLTLRRGDAALHLAGVDDMSFRTARLDRVLADLPPDGAAILLAHEPDFADISAASGRFDLQLSGHTHGGQVRLPLLGPIMLPRNGMRYPVGLYRVAGMYVYTNRGLGMGHLPVRINCRPEVTVFTLLARPSLPEG